jgi:hypothetical protein
VSASIESEADHRLYGEKPEVQFLAAEIRELGQRLGNKQRAET